MNWPAYGAFSAAEAACLSAAQSLRAELRPGGIKVVNVFSGRSIPNGIRPCRRPR